MSSNLRKATLIAAIMLSGATCFAAEPAPLAAQGCVGCHGVRGAGSDAVVALAGRSAGDIATAMKAFRANERPGTIMGRIARGYTDAEIAAIADYFASVR